MLAHAYAGLALIDLTRETIDGPETELFRRKLELDMTPEQIAESEKLQAGFQSEAMLPTQSKTWRN